MTASKWPAAEYEQPRDKYGILSASFDLYAFRLLVESFPNIENILELGSYIGGMPIYLNDILKKNKLSVKFPPAAGAAATAAAAETPHLASRSLTRAASSRIDWPDSHSMTWSLVMLLMVYS